MTMHRTTGNALFFWTVAALLSLCAVWLLHNHYINDLALQRWAAIISILDSTETRLEHLGLIYPHGPFYALIPFHLASPLDSAAAPYFVSVLFAAGLLALWNHHLTIGGFGRWLRWLLICLVMLHPALLWSATSGSHMAISLFMFYLLYIACLRMLSEEDTHSFILLGIVLALFFFVDSAAFFLFLALVPLLAIIAPRRLLLEAPWSVYVIIATPLAVMVVAWIFLNWMFHGSPWQFLTEPRSGFLGGRQLIEEIAWLRTYGGSWMMPSAVALIYTLVAYPAIALLLAQTAHGNPRRQRALIILLFHPVIAVGLATSGIVLEHPMHIISLVIAGLMAEITTLESRRKHAMKWLILMLMLGVSGGWAVFLHAPTPEMQRWADALTRQSDVPLHSGDIALGHWLAEHRAPTLIDNNSGYRVIVALSDARDLVLPFSDEFKLQLRRRRPDIELVAVPDPRSPHGARDAINLRYPQLYERGFEGWLIVYDHDGWRVWQRGQETVEELNYKFHTIPNRGDILE